MRHWNRSVFMFIVFAVGVVVILAGSLYQLGKSEEPTKRMVASIVEEK